MWSRLQPMLRSRCVPAVLLLAGIAFVWFRPRPAPDGGERVRSGLDLREGLLHVQGESQPFTGTLVENYTKDARKLEIPIREGKANGLSRGWFENGQQEVEETFLDGVSHGLRTRWYPDGRKKSEALISAGTMTGRFREWHSNGQKAAEVEMVDGQPHGPAEAWHPSGRLKSRVELDHGTPARKEFFPDTDPVARTETPVTAP